MQSWSTHPTPTLNHMEDVIILGSGPAGCTAAIYTARAGCSTLILGGPLPGGLLTQTPKIENYPGFPEPVSGFDLTDAMLRQAENVGAKVRYNVATKLSLQGDIKEVTLDDGTTLQSRTVILALGAKHRPIEVKGRGRLQGKAISYCATCDGAFYRGEPVALAGNGGAALNEALFLCGLASEVHLLVPSKELKGPQALRKRLEDAPSLHIHLETRLVDAVEADDGKLSKVVVESTEKGERGEIPCKGLFIAMGFSPDTGILEESGIALDADGYIKLKDPARTLTETPGVFAAGDCIDTRYKQAVVAAGSGAKAGMDAAEHLRTNPL